MSAVVPLSAVFLQNKMLKKRRESGSTGISPVVPDPGVNRSVFQVNKIKDIELASGKR